MNKVIKYSARYDKKKWYQNLVESAKKAAKINNIKCLYQIAKYLANTGKVATTHLKNKEGVLLTSPEE